MDLQDQVIAPTLSPIVRATPDLLVEVWPYIEKGLLEIKRRSKDITWIPVQIRRHLERSFTESLGVELFLVMDGQRIVGFYVMMPQFDAWAGCATSWTIWLSYGHQGGLAQKAMPYIEAEARRRGYIAVDFITSQPRLIRKMKYNHGFKQVYVQARKYL